MLFSHLTSLVIAATSAAAVPIAEQEETRGLKFGLHLGFGKQKSQVPFTFTSTYAVRATPDQVVDSSNKTTGGLPDSRGWFQYGINSKENVICYNITLENFRGEYQSPARTATHIHQAAKGKNGPPRIAFPNPTDIGNNRRQSLGCLRGPFKTGLNATDGTDTGDGFHVKQIEKNPCGFFTDVHSSLAVPGAVRGQLK